MAQQHEQIAQMLEAGWPPAASRPPVVAIGATCRSPPPCGARRQRATPRRWFAKVDWVLGKRLCPVIQRNVISMPWVWDNAAMESFFSSLKTERVGRKTYRTRDEARADVFDYIERFYNPKRRHSMIGYLSPMEFESQVELKRVSPKPGAGQRDTVIDGVSGITFVGFDARVGQTREIWFIHNHFLFEIMTYKELEPWLNQILATWRFTK